MTTGPTSGGASSLTGSGAPGSTVLIPPASREVGEPGPRYAGVLSAVVVLLARGSYRRTWRIPASRGVRPVFPGDGWGRCYRSREEQRCGPWHLPPRARRRVRLR